MEWWKTDTKIERPGVSLSYPTHLLFETRCLFNRHYIDYNTRKTIWRFFDQKHDCIFYTDLTQLVGIIPGTQNFGGDKSRYPPAPAASAPPPRALRNSWTAPYHNAAPGANVEIHDHMKFSIFVLFNPLLHELFCTPSARKWRYMTI